MAISAGKFHGLGVKIGCEYAMPRRKTYFCSIHRRMQGDIHHKNFNNKLPVCMPNMMGTITSLKKIVW